MNLFKKLGSIFTKMSPSKKTEKLAEKLIQQEKIKLEPIRDIEDIVNGTKSPYFSPIQTRNQRINKKISEIKPIPSLVHKAVLESAAVEKPTGKTNESKKATEIQAILEELKKLPPVTGVPLEVLPPESVKPLKTRTKKKEETSVDLKPKKIPKVSPKAAKAKTTIEETKEIPKVEEAIVKQELSSSPVTVKGKRKSKDSPKTPEVKLEKWEPKNWNEILENIKLMRAKLAAPVDTMGCHKCSDENADQKTQRFQTLVALMLSSQTKDQVTYDAMMRLKENSCTPATIANMDSTKLETILYPVSFYKNKAKYLKNTSKILIDRYDSDIPSNVNELIKLPGVGPKMAHICMSSAWDIVTGIGVDVHVHRISNRLGWVRNETKEPEHTRKELESWLPSDHWREVNYLLVGFGQTICTPTKPKCLDCLNVAICPSANMVKVKKLKKEKIVC